MQSMKMNLSKHLNKAISFCFYLLFFLTPLFFTPINSELFELNKMFLVYLLSTFILFFWLAKSIYEGKMVIRRTPLDIPLVIFLTSQIVSTLFSLDFHLSLWGYYGRFNGGLIPTITYLFLYFAFTSNFITEGKTYEKVKKLFSLVLLSGFFVSIYAILQRVGIDKDIWMQDVQNRVFSTFGQPNWLAAYIAILLPITMASLIISKIKNKKSEIDSKNLALHVIRYTLYVLCSMFYAVLLFTRSRSGFLAFWIVDIVFWSVLIILIKEFRKKTVLPFIICHLSFVILTFFFSSPFAEVNRYLNFAKTTLNREPNTASSASFMEKNQTPESKSDPAGKIQSETNITESGEIRKLVWQGAIGAFKARPLTGWGVETFAWVFYKFKPLEHNLTSEWDFLYNKAHNEYLNYAATSGGFGLGSHMLIIAVFIIWTVRQISKSEPVEIKLIKFGLFMGWSTILITNFFGFSVVMVNLFFYLIPAIIISCSEQKKCLIINLSQNPKAKILLLLFVLLFTIYCLLFTVFFWIADVFYAKAQNLEKSEEYLRAYKASVTAVRLQPNEPIFRDQLALESAYLGFMSFSENEATKSAEFAKQAQNESDLAIAISPNNLNFRKTRTRLFYILSEIDNIYLRNAIHSLLSASILAPNDAKILYNLAILYWSDGEKNEALKTLNHALVIKPNYKDAAYALAVFAESEKNKEEAEKWYQYILERIDPDDAEVKKKVEE